MSRPRFTVDRLRAHPGRVVGALILVSACLVLMLVEPRLIGERVVSAGALAAPAVAIGVTLLTKRLVPAFWAAVVVGAVAQFGPVQALPVVVERHVIENLLDRSHLHILGFSVALLGMVGVTLRSGAMSALVRSSQRLVVSRRSTLATTFGLGLLVFFDDYANSMLVGPTMREPADHHGVSREKLAYLVDSTAAPVAGLAIISTWVGYEVGLLQDLVRDLDLPQTGYALLLEALPSRFYCIFSLALVALVIVTGRDFGAMARAEGKAHGEASRRAPSTPLPPSRFSPDSNASQPGVHPERAHALHALLPFAAVVLVALVGLMVDGGGLERLGADPSSSFTVSFWRDSLGGSEHAVLVLGLAACAGSVVAALLAGLSGALSTKMIGHAFARGAFEGAPVLFVLVSAWALGGFCRNAGTGEWLVLALGEGPSPFWIPAASFLLSAAVAFATGTSWGTMAILLPVAVPLAAALQEPVVLVLTVASVLDGAIFGDHCSPISDTTLMSSLGAGCDHLEHVHTQLPYAALAMAVALLAYSARALELPLTVTYVAGGLGLLMTLRLLGARSGDTGELAPALVVEQPVAPERPGPEP